MAETEAATAEGTGSVERPRRQWSEARRAAAQKPRTGRSQPAGVTDADLIAEDVIGEAVDNITTLAGYVMPFAPYTAVTLMGVPDPESSDDRQLPWIVKSRAQMAGEILLAHAKTNRRLLAAVARFNLLFKNVELLEVAGSVVAAAAVDAHLVEPDATIALPGGLELPILAPAIGDTIEFIAAQERAAEAQARAEGREVPQRRRRTQSPNGVSEPEQPWSPDEPTAAQRAEAEETRRRLEARNAVIANGGVDPTLRREGQTIVPGDERST